MIYVIYDWSVSQEKLNQFLETWSEATQAIHRAVDGALGSFCLGCNDDPRTVKTIAKWETLTQWQSFIQTAKNGPMKALHDIATLNSSRDFVEFGNHLSG